MCSSVFSAVGTKFVCIFIFFFFCGPTRGMASTFMRFLEHTYNDAPQSVGLLWTSDQPDAETFIRQHTTLKRERHLCHRRDPNPQSQQSNGCRPSLQAARPLGPAIFMYSLDQNFEKTKVFTHSAYEQGFLLFCQVPIKVGQPYLLLNIFWGFFY